VSTVLQTPARALPGSLLFAGAGILLAGVLTAGLGLSALAVTPVVLVVAYALAGSVAGAGISLLASAAASAAMLGLWAFVPQDLPGYALASQLVVPAVLVLTLSQVSPVVRRFRAERRGGRTVAVAADVAMSTAGKSAMVAGAGMTAALIGLALGSAGQLATCATAAALVTLATLVVVTLLPPVLLTRLGGLERISAPSARRVTHLRATVVVTGAALGHPAAALTLTAVTLAALLVCAVRVLPLGPLAGAVVLTAGPLAGQLVLLLDRVAAATRSGMTWRNAVAGGTREAAGTITASAAASAVLFAVFLPSVTGFAAAALMLVASVVTVLAVPAGLLVARPSGSVAGQHGVSRPEQHGF
jgi:hypothetical protein